jgi:hypothetical protein
MFIVFSLFKYRDREKELYYEYAQFKEKQLKVIQVNNLIHYLSYNNSLAISLNSFGLLVHNKNYDWLSYCFIQAQLHKRQTDYLVFIDRIKQLQQHYFSYDALSLWEIEELDKFNKLFTRQASETQAFRKVIFKNVTALELQAYLEPLDTVNLLISFVANKEKRFFIVNKVTNADKSLAISLTDISYFTIKFVNELDVQAVVKILGIAEDTCLFVEEISLDSSLQSCSLMIETGYSRLLNQDKDSSFLMISGQSVSRTELYEWGIQLTPTQRKTDPFATYPMLLNQETLNQYLMDRQLRMPASNYLRLIKKIARPATNSSVIQQFNLIFNAIDFYGNPLDIQRAEHTKAIIKQYDGVKESASLWSKLYLYLKEPLCRTKRSVLGTLTGNVKTNRWANYAFKLQLGKMNYELVNDGSYQGLAYNLGEIFLGIQIQNLEESMQYFIRHKVKLYRYRALFSATPKVMVRGLLDQPAINTASWFFRGLKGVALSTFDIGRIAQGVHALHQPLEGKSYRDIVAQIVFASVSGGVEVGGKLLQIEERTNFLVIFSLTGFEMTYNGLNALYESKSYGLSLWQNFRLYWHTLFVLPEPLDIKILENEANYRNYCLDHAVKQLEGMGSGTLIVAVGRLVNQEVGIIRRETGGWFIGRRYMRKEKQYIAVWEAAFASIDLNQCQNMTGDSEEIVVSPDKLNVKVIFAALKTTCEAEANACHSMGDGCVNVIGLSHLKNEMEPDLSHIVYDLTLQDSGLVQASDIAETNIFNVYEGNQTIYGGGDSCKKNLFVVKGRFMGEIIGGESHSHVVANILDTSNLTRAVTSVRFSSNQIILDQHQIFFTAIKLTEYIGGEGRYDFIDCQNMQLINVDTLGGWEGNKAWLKETESSLSVETEEYWWDFIKNCPQVMLSTFTRVAADVPGNYFYFIKSGQYSIHIKSYTGNTTLFFDEVNFFTDTDFYYNIVNDSLEVRNKTQQAIIKIDNYLTNSQTNALRNVINFFDKSNHSLAPLLDKLTDSHPAMADQFVLINSFIFRKETQLATNDEILLEYLNSIDPIKSRLNLLGIVTQKNLQAVKLIATNWPNIVIPLGIDKLDLVFGDSGVDIYLLSYFDIKETLILQQEKEVHINNLAKAGIDILVIPVLITELDLQREVDNLIVSFLEFPNFRIIIDYYFLNEYLQHLVVTDKLGREWVFLTNDISIKLIPFYRDLSVQLKTSVSAEMAEVYPIALQADFANFTFFNDIYGLNLEVFQENGFLEFSLEKLCKENTGNFKIYSNTNARLIDETVEVNYIDCLGLQALRKVTIDREKFLDMVNSRKLYFSLPGIIENVTIIDIKNPSNGTVSSINPEAHLIVNIATMSCLISREESNLKFEFFTRDTSLGSAVVVDWLNPKNRLYSIENIRMEIIDLASWDFDRLNELQKFINKELLKNYLEHWAFTCVGENASMLHSIETLLLLFHYVADSDCLLKNSANVYKIINFVSYDSLFFGTKSEILNEFQTLLTTQEAINGLILTALRLAAEDSEILPHVTELFEKFSINSTHLIALNNYLPDFIDSLANTVNCSTYDPFIQRIEATFPLVATRKERALPLKRLRGGSHPISADTLARKNIDRLFQQNMVSSHAVRLTPWLNCAIKAYMPENLISSMLPLSKKNNDHFFSLDPYYSFYREKVFNCLFTDGLNFPLLAQIIFLPVVCKLLTKPVSGLLSFFFRSNKNLTRKVIFSKKQEQQWKLYLAKSLKGLNYLQRVHPNLDFSLLTSVYRDHNQEFLMLKKKKQVSRQAIELLSEKVQALYEDIMEEIEIRQLTIQTQLGTAITLNL